ncbi:MAG: T9SS type A sorting domain-containing protein [Bacteroidota bacterium]
MRQAIRILGTVLLAAVLCWVYQQTGTMQTSKTSSQKPSSLSPSEPELKKLPKETRIDKAMDEEFLKTRDPKLNVVPRERLLRAKASADAKRYLRRGIEGIKWEERGPNNVAGRTRAILIDASDPSGETVFAGGVGGGIWKTTNISSIDPQWVPINDFFDNIAISSIAQDPTNPDIIYFGTGEGWYNGDAIRGLGIWKSIDGGDNWSQLGATKTSTFHYVQKIVIDAQGHVFAATRNGGLQKSTNGGSSWTRVLGGGTFASSVRAADIEIAADGDLFAAMGIQSTDGIYRSTNGGSTWQELTTGLPSNDYERIELACAPSAHNYIYALFQDESNNQCKGIWRSVNGGNSWTEVGNPSARGMSNFARNQAWYDLIAAVDPIDPTRLFIGGVDLLVSEDAGVTWTQISQWYGGFGIQYVHADQHAIVFQQGNSNVILFGNDGGVYRTTNGSSSVPTIEGRNLGYNVTQYYACAIHPEIGRDEFLAGSQDNGTQQYRNAGINNTTEVTGGDGAFCHIDKDQPNIQISSYIYNVYHVTTDSWNTRRTYRIGSNQGRFINPTDYDSETNTLYGAYDGGYYSRMRQVGTANTRDSVWIPEFSRSKVSTVKISPNVPGRVYFGLANGDIVRVDGANTEAASGTVVRSGSGFTSSIDIERGDEDHMLTTYSNYGTNSVWESKNGGQTWSSVEGDLPDMPVRWGLFAPGDATKAVLATEVGVWSTDALSATTTEWDPSNSGLANTRIDMLRYRESDYTMIAATHGRGLFSTDFFSPIVAKYEMEDFTVSENDPENEIDFCSPYRSITIPVSINKEPNTTITINVTVDTPSTTVDLVSDVLINKGILRYEPGQPLTDNIELTIFDDAEAEDVLETLVLNLDTTNNIVARRQITMQVRDDDAAVDLSGGGGTFEMGGGTERISVGPFGGFFTDGRTQVLYKASDLIASGLTSGNINQLSLEVVVKNSRRPYPNFRIGILQKQMNELGQDFESGNFVTVFEDDVDPVLGWNQFDFQTPFVWDGTSDLIIEFCYDDVAFTSNDVVTARNVTYVGLLNRQDDGNSGCTMDRPTIARQVPNIRFTKVNNLEIATALGSAAEAYLGNGQTIDIFSNDGKLMASIRQIDGPDVACLDVRIDRSGTGSQQPSWLSGLVTDKTIHITSDFNAPYILTLYYTQEEMAVWGGDTLGLNFLKVDDAVSISDGTGLQIEENSSLTAVSYPSVGVIAYSDTFNTFSGFALTLAQTSLPVEWLSFDATAHADHHLLQWQTASELNNAGFEVERSMEGGEFEKIGFVAAKGGIETAYDFVDGDVVQTGRYYYRLRQVDLNGQASYSEVVTLLRQSKEVQWSVFPNPSQQFVNLRYQSPHQGQVEVDLLDQNGRLLHQLSSGRTDQLQESYDLKSLGLSAGIYFVRLRNEQGEVKHQKIAFY